MIGVEKSAKFLLVCFTAAEEMGPELIGIRGVLLNIESDIPSEFYSGNALDIGSILDIR